MATARAYDSLVDKDLEDASQEEEMEEEEEPEESGRAQPVAQACFPLCIFCCCCIFFFGFMGIGSALFAPPEPREEPGTQIWSPVLPQNFSTCSRTFFWTSQEVITLGSPCYNAWWFSSGTEVAQGTWEPGWSFFSLYYYYEKHDATGGLEATIHVQSLPRFFAAEFRMWRGEDSPDAPIISIVQDYWAQPWFAYEKVRIFDVHQDSVHIARFTETVTPAWVGYGGATVDIGTPSGELATMGSRSLGTMTQPGVFWLLFFRPPSWEIQNLDPQAIPSAVPGFYSLFSDIVEQQQATGPIFWICFFCIICTNNSK